MLRQMLVPVDFSTCARQVARHAFDLARAIGGQVTLLHVLEDQPPEEARDLLRQLSALARRPPECLIVPEGSAVPSAVAAVILEVAARRGADLIVLGLRGPAQHSPQRLVAMGPVAVSPVAGGQLALGQVATQVLLGAQVPVQFVPCGLTAAPTHERWRGFLRRDSLERGSLERDSLERGSSVQGDLRPGGSVTPGAVP